MSRGILVGPSSDQIPVVRPTGTDSRIKFNRCNLREKVLRVTPKVSRIIRELKNGDPSDPLLGGVGTLASLGVRVVRSTFPRLDILLGDTAQKALVDSGSSRCLISADLFHSLRSYGQMRQVERKTSICRNSVTHPSSHYLRSLD